MICPGSVGLFASQQHITQSGAMAKLMLSLYVKSLVAVNCHLRNAC